MNRASAEEIFRKVLDQPAQSRAMSLEALCGPDPALRAEVESLLRADANAQSLVSPRLSAVRKPTSNQDDGTVVSSQLGPKPPESDATPGERPGDMVGFYKLLERIGEGGFGVVWVAEQREPVRRKVALKIVKAGMDTREVLTRFEAERQALAMLDHPNVAKVFDTGATQQGRPYFVMEHVPGLPITEYCDTGKLRIRQRLELFIPICQAVQHAHSKGIIHRDLKPSNILVTLHDGKAVPKVIDFGIAKATIGRLTDRTLYTEMGRLLGTPEYMAPEQAVTSGLDVDTRSDIYSLGVILYQLLTGTLPFDPKTLRSAGIDGMAKIIREMEPPKPSTRLSTMATEKVNRNEGQTPQEIGKQHGATFPELRRELNGDLDWIVMKCLEKDRARRYETANGLAMDVQRHLAGEAVLAAPPSTWYRLTKFTRRHRVGVMSGGAIAAALVLAIIGTAAGLVRARAAEAEQSRLRISAEAETARAVAAQQAEIAQRKMAEQATALAREEAENARAVSGFFESMFTSVDPIGLGRAASGGAPGASKADDEFWKWVGTPMASGQEITVLELLHRTVPTLEKAFSGRPAMEASVRQTIGRTLFGLGLPWEADTQLEKAVEAWKKVRGPDHPDTLLATIERAEEMLTDLGMVGQATGLLEGAAAGLEKAVGPEDRRTLRAKVLLAGALRRNSAQTDRALALGTEVSRTLDRVYGPDDHDSVQAKIVLAEALTESGRGDEAEQVVREAAERSGRLFGADNFLSQTARQVLGEALRMQGRCQEAIDAFGPLLMDIERTLGPVHFKTFLTRNALLEAYLSLGRGMDFARQLKDEALVLERQRGADDYVTIKVFTCAVALSKSGDVLGGANELEQLVNRLNQKDGGSQASRVRELRFVRSWYLRAFAEAEKPDESIPRMVQEVARTRQLEPPNYERLCHQLLGLGKLYAKAKQHEKAVTCYREAFEARAKQAGAKFGAAYINTAWIWLADSVAAMGNRDEDIAFIENQLKLAKRDMVDNPRMLGFYYNSVSGPLRNGGRNLEQLVEWGRLAHELLAQKSGEDDPATIWSGADTHARALFAAGRTTEGEKLIRESVARMKKCCPGDVRLPRMQAKHAEMLLSLGRRDDAMPMLTAACEELVKLRNDDRSKIKEDVEILAKQLEASGDTAGAARWRGRVNEGVRPKCR